MAHTFGGKVAPGQKREYGKAMVSRTLVCVCVCVCVCVRVRVRVFGLLGRPYLPARPWLLVFATSAAPHTRRVITASSPQANLEAAELLFHSMPAEFQMWMSHGDKLHNLPDG
jgi:hypothetical protein